MNNITRTFLGRRAALLATGALALGGLLAAVHAAQDSSPALSLKRDSMPIVRTANEPVSFADIVKRVAPSVVKITVETKAQHVRGNDDFPGLDDPFFRHFFGGRIPQRQTPARTGLGSGVIISTDGVIVTNNHVIDGADRVTVTMENGRDYTAKVLGRDPQTDIAVIKIEAKNLPAVTLAEASTVEVGDRVLAIGNPFGIGETVTSGIVSAKGRRVGILSEVNGYENFIQTDAAINPGNSGGALVDIKGRLVGINTAILSRSGGFQGVGLAVPSDVVGSVAENLAKNGKMVRGFLGVSAQDITPNLAESFDLKEAAGALVAEVKPNSPAAKAGLKEGDIITAINGEPVTDSNKLTFKVGSIAPGTQISIDVLRNGKTENLSATTGERPGAKAGRETAVAGNNAGEVGVLNGVGVEDITAEARRELRLPQRLQGAVITDVAPDSAAARAGVNPGDVILEINRQRVENAEDAVKLSEVAEGKKTLLKLWSRGATIFVVVDETDEAGDSR